MVATSTKSYRPPRTARRNRRQRRPRLHSPCGRSCQDRESRRRRHQSDRQERALPRRIPPSRPYRIPRRTCRRWRIRAWAAGDDVVVAGARRRSRDHPSFVARGARELSTDLIVTTARIADSGPEDPFRPCPSPACRIGPQPACRRRRVARQRRHRHGRTGGRSPARSRHPTSVGLIAGGHHVSRRGAQDLRLRHLHVSRSGTDPDEDAALRRCRQPHARTADRPHLARSRHCSSTSRHRYGPPVEPRRAA